MILHTLFAGFLTVEEPILMPCGDRGLTMGLVGEIGLLCLEAEAVTCLWMLLAAWGDVNGTGLDSNEYVRPASRTGGCNVSREFRQ
jgi:hypothetical protein